MDHNLLKQVIEDQRENIKTQDISSRDYVFERNANYVLVGLRRAGKSVLMYKKVLELIEDFVDWEQIIYINFEDERLVDFNYKDFNDILEVQRELSAKEGYYFFDEIQNIANWEKFCRRMADSHERVWITGSNAKMLLKDALTTLGARYWPKIIYPYSFHEFLCANGIDLDKDTLNTKEKGDVKRLLNEYFQYGGLPEILQYQQKREYVELVYQKIQLGDVIQRNQIRNPNALKSLVRKIAESVCSDISYTKLTNLLKSVGYKITKDTIIDYISYVENAYIIFRIKNYTTNFVEKETNSKYYFVDNGILNLFLTDKNSKLLENIVAILLHQRFEEKVYYLKSSVTGVDVDFVLPEVKMVIQVAYSLKGEAREREIKNLIHLSKVDRTFDKFMIVTYEEEEIIDTNGIKIDVIPLYKFLL